jgi:hypothetical protein
VLPSRAASRLSREAIESDSRDRPVSAARTLAGVFASVADSVSKLFASRAVSMRSTVDASAPNAVRMS